MSLRHVRLEMAREPAYPQGNPNRGYELVLPLGADDRIDAAEWEKNPSACTVERFWDGEKTELGYLERNRAGQWVFDYDFDDEADDEEGFRFGEHAFRTGEYVSIADHEGTMHTFTVVRVTPA
ncbi:MAG: hypothetical protein RIB53_13350 [Roseitalea porphyridii]|jgi:hypothetical protein|uniref:Uncharacterized protein n=1 Tax=Roseitalea porphyridii TaxID=1852022 RepID=A0A4P6V4Q6_9HYPH|nr:hypothetical protein [Roseitalea porphyridii]QBK31794.1 hypothetical protein E0E05_14990 [Roseitalea porphyridii]